MDYSPPGSSIHRIFPGKKTGLGCYFLLQGIFPIWLSCISFIRWQILQTEPPGKQIWKTQQWPQDWKRSVFIPIPKKGNPKECSNYHTIVLISHASKVMLKILQARLLQYMNHELPDVQAGFREGRGTRDQIANICWIIEKAREFQKNIYLCFSNYVKTFDCGSLQTVENP